MRNVTITLDDETARWARVEAAKKDISLSRLIRDLLEETYKRDAEYENAMERFFSREPTAPISDGTPYPRRADLYDR